MSKNVVIVLDANELEILLDKYSKHFKENPKDILLSNIKDVIISLGIENVKLSKQYIDSCIDLLQYIIFNPLRTGLAILPNYGYVSLDVDKIADYFHITIKGIGDKNVIS